MFVSLSDMPPCRDYRALFRYFGDDTEAKLRGREPPRVLAMAAALHAARGIVD